VLELTGLHVAIQVPGTAVDNPTSMIKKDEQAVSEDGEDIEVPGTAVDNLTSMTKEDEQAGSGDGELESTFF
jgi:hypothetical protein